VRVHEHLLARADLSDADRQRAQHALAQDFMKAGLFDRAEAAYRALEGTPFETEARLARLALYERSRDWRAAAETAAQLEKIGAGSFGSRIAHHWCELAQEADERGDAEQAEAALQRAREVAPNAARALLQSGRRAARAGRPRDALAAWNELKNRNPLAFNLVARDYARAAKDAGQVAPALATLNALYERNPSVDLLQAIALLDEAPEAAPQRVAAHLALQPSLAAAAELLRTPPARWSEPALQGLRDAVERAAKPLQRYRCAACGFEAQHYFWQCPGCLNWDSYPPQRVEEL
jgi:lipopolysaccharide biosynthesis regulator YciM